MKLKKTNSTKTSENGVELEELTIDLDTEKCGKTIKELANFELNCFFQKLKFIGENHNLIPVLKDIKIEFEVKD